MQQVISIQGFAARYRLPASADDERRRLDRALGEVMEWALEEALERKGVPTEGELCIRNIYAVVNLRLSGTDRSLALAWGEALAQSIKHVVDGAQVPGVAHYSSRVQALIDLAVGVSLGDLKRYWAWRQIGLWSAGRSANDAGRVSDREAMFELLRALVHEPSSIIPVLRALAEQRILERLATRFSTEQWTTLAGAALSIANSSLSLAHISVRLDQTRAPAAVVSANSLREARRLVSASILAQPLAAAATTSAQIDPGEIAHAEVARAFAILTILDANPVTFRAGREKVRDLTVAVAQQLAPTDWLPASYRFDPLSEALQPASSNAESDATTEMPVREVEKRVPEQTSTAEDLELKTKAAPTGANDLERDARTLQRPGHKQQRRDQEQDGRKDEWKDQEQDAQRDRQQDEQNRVALAGQRDLAARNSDAAAESTDAESPDFDQAADERPIPAVRKRGFTTFGGLFFLLGVVEDLGLPELILADEAFREHSFRWTMQRLALALVPAEPTDAAVLAFAGLASDAGSPAETEEPATKLEDKVIAEFKDRIVEHLRERLKRPDEGATELLQFVCERRAEIVTDPGWIEAHLSLDEVSTEIRRSGLDLDPGYLPWLGVVVKFIYE